jgi:hypothetical protein
VTTRGEEGEGRESRAAVTERSEVGGEI